MAGAVQAVRPAGSATSPSLASRRPTHRGTAARGKELPCAYLFVAELVSICQAHTPTVGRSQPMTLALRPEQALFGKGAPSLAWRSQGPGSAAGSLTSHSSSVAPAAPPLRWRRLRQVDRGALRHALRGRQPAEQTASRTSSRTRTHDRLPLAIDAADNGLNRTPAPVPWVFPVLAAGDASAVRCMAPVARTRVSGMVFYQLCRRALSASPEVDFRRPCSWSLPLAGSLSAQQSGRQQRA